MSFGSIIHPMVRPLFPKRGNSKAQAAAPRATSQDKDGPLGHRNLLRVRCFVGSNCDFDRRLSAMPRYKFDFSQRTILSLTRESNFPVTPGSSLLTTVLRL